MSLIQVSNLTIGYKNRKKIKKQVATDLTLRLEPGELICLVGPNGSGKSTLLKTITGLLPPLNGTVFISGKDIQTLSPLERARRVSVVLTNPVVPGQLTVYDVCSLGRYPYTDWVGTLTSEDHTQIERAMDAIGIKHFAHRYLHELSDGERQKVMIARAMAQDSQLIILDEPTAFLDVPYRMEIMHILQHIGRQENRGILLSTHDLDLAMRTANALWVISKEGEFYSGAPEDMVLNGIISQVFAIGNVLYDREKGQFHIPVHQKGKAVISGENGHTRFWTERAMERIGYETQDVTDPQIRVNILKKENDITWVIQTPQDTQEFSNLTDSIHRLQNSNEAM